MVSNKKTLHLLFCLVVTVQCTRDGQFVVVLAREATLPKIELNSVRLLETDDPLCRAVGETSVFVIFQFPVTACGTTREVGELLTLLMCRLQNLFDHCFTGDDDDCSFLSYIDCPNNGAVLTEP